MTDWVATLQRALGAQVVAQAPLLGGDFSKTLVMDLSDDRRVVVKLGALVEIEGQMLGAMGQAGADVPAVLFKQSGVLCLEWLEEGQAERDGWQRLGQTLRTLHGHHAESFGWPQDYAFGPVEIDNRQRSNWAGFWAEQRLAPSIPSLPPALAKRADAVLRALPEMIPGRPQPALLHGDMWQGNVLFTPGRTALIDPACYFGAPEVDLAMLGLFGHPPPAFWEAYGPLDPGYEHRRLAYQLWPALVHARLFGASYHRMVAGLLDQIGV